MLVSIGGKDFRNEQTHIGKMNILIATPGRILQHLEQTYGFSTDQLVMLVLDEADRILDMGFKKTLNAILRFMPPPPQRQTLLFSATQTRKVKDLARLSLNNPEYVSVHDKAEFATPRNLKQMYVVTPIKEKLNVLFSFIKTHLKDKILVFCHLANRSSTSRNNECLVFDRSIITFKNKRNSKLTLEHRYVYECLANQTRYTIDGTSRKGETDETSCDI